MNCKLLFIFALVNQNVRFCVAKNACWYLIRCVIFGSTREKVQIWISSYSVAGHPQRSSIAGLKSRRQKRRKEFEPVERLQIACYYSKLIPNVRTSFSRLACGQKRVMPKVPLGCASLRVAHGVYMRRPHARMCSSLGHIELQVTLRYPRMDASICRLCVSPVGMKIHTHVWFRRRGSGSERPSAYISQR